MGLRRDWFDGLVDDSGTGTNGTVWDKATIGGLYDTIDLRVRDWAPIPFSVDNFIAVGGAQWVVEAADVSQNRFAVIGETLFWNLNVSASSVRGVTTDALYIRSPYFLTLLGGPGAHLQACDLAYDAGVYTPAIVEVFDNITVRARRVGANWTVNENGTYVVFNGYFSVVN